MPTLTATREDMRIAWLAALAITIHIAESALPSPLPGIKPGLANVITLVVLLRYGLAAAAWVALLRVFAGSLILGTFLSPTFMLSLSGALASLCALAAGYGLGRVWPAARLSALGLSVLAALAHMAGQFWLAYAWFIPHPGLLYLLPLLMTAAVIFGVLSGIISHAMSKKLEV